jgi:ABC-type enterobactin transport system permease subunit
MAALAKFQGLILVGLGIGMFLTDLHDILDTQITWSGNMLVSGWLAVSLHYCDGLNIVMD